jgi:hypothetical protein
VAHPNDLIALELARGEDGRTNFDSRRIQLLAKFFACGRATIERLPIPLGAAKEHRIGPGYWLYVESSGDALVKFSPVMHRDHHQPALDFPLSTGRVFPGEFEEGVISVPSGLSGTMQLWVARFPVPLPLIQEIIGSVSTLSVARPLIMAAPAFGTSTAAGAVILAANPARRFLSLENTDAAKVVSISFDAAPVALSGVILQPLRGKSWNEPGEDVPRGEVRAISPAGNTNVAIQEGT